MAMDWPFMYTTPAPDRPREDECSGCEGWAEVDHRDLCSGCAWQVDHDPWQVVAGIDRELVDAGPFTQEQAELRARVHNDGLRYADRGVLWQAERIARSSRGGGS